MATTLLVIGVLLMCAATVLAFRPIVPAAVIAYVALMFMKWSGHITVGVPTLVFWGIAALLVLMIASTSTAKRPGSYTPTLYIAGATLAGTVTGLIISHAAMVAGACLGAIIGAIAYSRTPAGRQSSPGLPKLLGAEGLPAVVTFGITGEALSALVAQAATTN